MYRSMDFTRKCKVEIKIVINTKEVLERLDKCLQIQKYNFKVIANKMASVVSIYKNNEAKSNA